MKVYNPGDVADLLKCKTATLRKYSVLLENAGYTFQKNSRKQRYYTDGDIITLRKLITLKDNGMTLDESVEGVMLWHSGNESEQEGIAPYQTETHNGIQNNADDIQELKDMIHKQNELIETLSSRLDQQDKRMEERDQALMESINQSMETQKQLAAAEDKPGFFKRLFKK